MITLDMVRKGYQFDIIKLIESPNDDMIVCQIGDYWFYYDLDNTENNIEQLKKDNSEEDIVRHIHETLCDFYVYEVFIDEYMYYEYYLEEHGITED